MQHTHSQSQRDLLPPKAARQEPRPPFLERLFLRGAAVAALVIAFTATCSGQTAVWLNSPNTLEDMARIEQALARRGSVAFVDTALKTALLELSDQFDLQIKIANRKLEEAAVSDETPVTLTVNNLPLESILELLLHDIELSWTISENVLLISSADDLTSAERILMRAYPVLDLIQASDGSQLNQVDFEPLIEVITTTVGPQTWDDVGGPGSVIGHPNTGVLVVAQTLEIQRRVERLLASLRQLKTEQQNIVRPSRAATKIQPTRRRRSAEPVAVKRYSATAVQAWQLPVVRSE